MAAPLPRHDAWDVRVLRAADCGVEVVFTARLPTALLRSADAAASAPPARILLARLHPSWRTHELSQVRFDGLAGSPRPCLEEVEDALLAAILADRELLFDWQDLAGRGATPPAVSSATLAGLSGRVSAGGRQILRPTLADLAEYGATRGAAVMASGALDALLHAAADGALPATLRPVARDLRDWLLARRATLTGAVAKLLCRCDEIDCKVADPDQPDGDRLGVHLVVEGWAFEAQKKQHLVHPEPVAVLVALPRTAAPRRPGIEDLFPLPGRGPSVLRRWRARAVPVPLLEALRGDLQEHFVRATVARPGVIRLDLDLEHPAGSGTIRYRRGREAQDILSAVRVAIRKHSRPWGPEDLLHLEDRLGRILSNRGKQDREVGPRLHRRMPAGLAMEEWEVWWVEHFPGEEPRFISPAAARDEWAPILAKSLRAALAESFPTESVERLVREELLDPSIWRGLQTRSDRWWHRSEALSAMADLVALSARVGKGALHQVAFDPEEIYSAILDSWEILRADLLERHLDLVKDMLRPALSPRSAPRTGPRAAPLFAAHLVGTIGAEAWGGITKNTLDGLFPDKERTSRVNTCKIPWRLVFPAPWDVFLARTLAGHGTAEAARVCDFRSSAAFSAFVRSESPLGRLEPVEYAGQKPSLVAYCRRLTDHDPSTLPAALAAGWLALAITRAVGKNADPAELARAREELAVRHQDKERRTTALLAGRSYPELNTGEILDLAHLFGRLHGDPA
ncbi:MAG: hypothetical protein ABIO70_10650 [Pseudomonadota bacterium]